MTPYIIICDHLKDSPLPLGQSWDIWRAPYLNWSASTCMTFLKSSNMNLSGDKRWSSYVIWSADNFFGLFSWKKNIPLIKVFLAISRVLSNLVRHGSAPPKILEVHLHTTPPTPKKSCLSTPPQNFRKWCIPPFFRTQPLFGCFKQTLIYYISIYTQLIIQSLLFVKSTQFGQFIKD